MIRKMMRKMTNNRGFQELGETGQGVSQGTPGILVIKCLKVKRREKGKDREEDSQHHLQEKKRIRSRSRDFLKE